MRTRTRESLRLVVGGTAVADRAHMRRISRRGFLRGFRVPALVISPYARRSHISSTVFDHTSILKMIENRWDLPALSVRDANAADLSEVLDLSTANLAAPSYSVPSVLSLPCGL